MSRRRDVPGAETDQARRNAFLKTVIRVFSQRGFEAPAMDELAAACGCDRRTLYRYFPGKEDLFWSAAERAYGMLTGRFHDASAIWQSGRVPALSRVRSWVFTYFDFSLENPDAFRLIMEGRQRAVAAHVERGQKGARPVHQRLGHSAAAMAELDRSVLSTLSGLGRLLESEGHCEAGAGDERLWELLGISIGLIEFHARYRGGGAGLPFGTPEGIHRMLERQIEAAFGLKEKRR